MDGLYTFGAPGSASPGFVLTSADGGCFPGARVVTLRTRGESEQTDPITWVASMVSLWHPRMDLYLLDVDDPSKDRYYPCTLSNVQHWPNSTWMVRAEFSLHSGTYFDQVAAGSSNTFVKRLSCSAAIEGPHPFHAEFDSMLIFCTCELRRQLGTGSVVHP